MDLSGYKVRIVGGNHVSGSSEKLNAFTAWSRPLDWSPSKSYVEMEDSQQYKIRLQNTHSERCEAKVVIDGNHVGTWLIPANRSITVERPVYAQKKFTFFRTESNGGQEAGLSKGDPSNGLVQVTFTPEANSYSRVISCNSSMTYGNTSLENAKLGRDSGRSSNCMSDSSMSFCATGITGESSGFDEGGTGLKGRSEQKFGRADEMDLDFNRSVTISVRLVARKRHYSPFDQHDRITPLGFRSRPTSNPVPPPVNVGGCSFGSSYPTSPSGPKFFNNWF